MCLRFLKAASVLSRFHTVQCVTCYYKTAMASKLQLNIWAGLIANRLSRSSPPIAASACSRCSRCGVTTAPSTAAAPKISHRMSWLSFAFCGSRMPLPVLIAMLLLASLPMKKRQQKSTHTSHDFKKKQTKKSEKKHLKMRAGFPHL